MKSVFRLLVVLLVLPFAAAAGECEDEYPQCIMDATDRFESCMATAENRLTSCIEACGDPSSGGCPDGWCDPWFLRACRQACRDTGTSDRQSCIYNNVRDEFDCMDQWCPGPGEGGP